MKGEHIFNGQCLTDEAIPNGGCLPEKDDYTVTSGGECVLNCIDVTDTAKPPTKRMSTPGFHDLEGTCTKDPDTTDDKNPPCLSGAAGKSVNAQK